MNCYMKTYSGTKINPLEPKADEINLVDIAHALSLNCRGNGQTKHFYSVAQHCINAAYEAEARGYERRIQLACLLHDAAEAYITDLIRPIKEYMPKYIEIENGFLKVVFERFDLDDITEEEWKLVKAVDDDLLAYDMVYLLQEQSYEDRLRCVRSPELDFVPFETVEKEYIELANFLISQLDNA